MKVSLTVFCLSLVVLIAGTEGVRQPGPCEKQCTKELEYHCGSDGKTYNNKCIFEIESCRYPNLKLAHKGKCVSTASEAPTPPPPRCRKGCQEIYSPVCGNDGKTYGNECELNIANCHDSTIKLAHMGECKKACSDACPLNYDPVCGSDGKTYSNACNLVAASCKASGTTPVLTQVHRGECKTCPDACITLYDPVCGNDGKTYGNSCELDIASCKDSRISQLHKGPCKSAREDQKDRDEEEEEEEEASESGKRRCPTICTLEYNPVCGSNGRTYSNPCGLSIAQCHDPSITLASNGRCGGGGLF